MRRRRGKLKFSHGVVPTEVVIGGQAPRGVEVSHMHQSHVCWRRPGKNLPSPHCHAPWVPCHVGSGSMTSSKLVGRVSMSMTSYLQSDRSVWDLVVRQRRPKVWLRTHCKWPKGAPPPGMARVILCTTPTILSYR